MILCINPNCNQPNNPQENRFCGNCGSELLLSGRYQVIQQINQHSYNNNSSCKYEVREVGNETVKYLQTLTSNNSQEIEHFHKTGEVLKQLNHPGLPKVEVDGCFIYFPRDKATPLHCLVIEKITGLTLDDYILSHSSTEQAHQALDEKLVINWLQQIVEILQQIHSHDLLHLHIQPANIILQNNGNLALVGFGEPQINKQVQFIAAYTPPEQINNSAVSQSDFFALGRTFAFLLTGKSPLSYLELYEPNFNNSNADNTNLDNVNSKYTNLQNSWHSHTTKISSKIVNLLDAMMSPIPRERPQSTEEILQTLAELNPTATPLMVSQTSLNPSILLPRKTRFSWSFLFVWIIAIASCGTIGGFIGFVAGFLAEFILGAVFKNITVGFIFGGAIFGLITGIGIGLAQSILLRQSYFKLRWWFLVTVLGFIFEGILSVFSGSYGTQNKLFIIPGLAVGICQWLVLQRYIRIQTAFWWVLASVAGGGVAVGINKAVNYYFGNAYSIFGIVLGLFGFAIVTGIVLQFLLMRYQKLT
ncbi:protein kinase domain-containing protein [Calothrix sp. UHCC 0171]|uniref:protein kinase domain-containing protein n=1 Tax=Calothrix sp. UHCC 0171 TaxID=3110245 RepID=UPI002B20830A|nr:protein kinase [Calothrix sp. UHCC 0171]MEA5571779.1 protein kinase [Calothrix sp. UHCC 0171]